MRNRRTVFSRESGANLQGFTMERTRQAGVILHPTSLPGNNGIGELGCEAREFIEWMADAGLTLWQVMPLGPTGYGDSPYQCFSAFAGNPMLISLDELVEEGWLEREDLADLRKLPKDHVDFGAIIPAKQELLQSAFNAWRLGAGEEQRADFDEFRRLMGGWLTDYALFMALKQFNGGKVWTEWPEAQRDRATEALGKAHDELKEGVESEEWRQYQFFTQWWKLRHFAKERGVSILGDLPIFVAHDSVDVWANRRLFFLDDCGNPTVVAGVPPDYFSETGQRWGNPLYRWEEHEKDGFGWWTARVGTVLELVDLVRVDHFRGFAGCWEIPASETTAVKGRWVDAPGHALFERFAQEFGKIPLVAEDLGVITDDVVKLRKSFGLPGMKVLQFAWGEPGSDNPFLPHNHEPDSIVYPGTHDNNTTRGWWARETDGKIRSHISEYLGRRVRRPDVELLRLAWSSVSCYAVAMMQDLLRLGARARMNTPSVAQGNWSWRVQKRALTRKLAGKLRRTMVLYGRLEKEECRDSR